MEPRVSVVVPTHDRPDDVRRAVRSALAQDERALEVLVVDDGSDPAVDAAALRADPRVRVLRQDAATGVSGARNAGIAQARGEWVAFLDDDDLWRADKLTLQLDAGGRAAAGTVSTGYLLVTDAGRVTGRFAAPAVQGEALRAELLGRNALGSPSTVIARRDLLERAGGFDPALSNLADWDLWLRLAELAPVAAVADAPAAIVVHEGSMQIARAQDAERELALLRDRHRATAAALGAPMTAPMTEIWLAQKRWEARRSPAHLAAYAGALARRPGRLATLGTGLRRRLAPEQAPAWVLEQLGAAAVGPA